MAKKTFTKKSDITRLIRDAFREKSDSLMTEEDAVKELVDKVAEEYELPVATLAFFVQKINAFRLFESFKAQKDVQTYPVVVLIDVRKFCKQYGYDDIYSIIKANISAKINGARFVKKSSLNMEQYGEIRKAAALSEDMKITFESDREKAVFNKFASSRLGSKLKDLTEMYSTYPGIETFIKQAQLDSDLNLKPILSILRATKKDTFVKEADLKSFLVFKKELEEFKKDAMLLGVLGDNSTTENAGEQN